MSGRERCKPKFNSVAIPSYDRSLYVHVPFCRHRCGYCNFSLVAGRDQLIERYLRAIEWEVAQVDDIPEVTTVFFGGGTPSHLSRPHLEKLTKIFRERFNWRSDVEFSIECNPSDLNEEKRDVFRDIKINRISFGVQSFSDTKLALLERDHRFSEIEHALKLAQTITDNISLDLIFAVPGETEADWQNDLDTAISFSPRHLSTYELTIEKGTQFWNRHYHGKLNVPDEDRRFDLYCQTIETISAAGYEQYEISSFAQSGFRCRHNLAYWNGNDYYAFGPGAASYVGGVRRINHRSTTAYLNRIESGESPVTQTESLTPQEQAIDMVVFGLRQLDGVSIVNIRNRTGYDIGTLGRELISKLEGLDLMQCRDERMKLTDKGTMLYDSVCQDWFNLL